MVDLALKNLLHDKLRSVITILGIAFAVTLVLVQVGLFLGLLSNASLTIEKLDADLWVTSKNTPNVDFAHTFPEAYVDRVRSIDGIAYAAAKAGVINMTRAMAVQLAEYGIRVNCIVPNRSGSPVGYDDDMAGSRTFQNLAGRLGTADDQAKAALFLVSDDSSFIIGHPLIVDGGVMATANFPREQFQK